MRSRATVKDGVMNLEMANALAIGLFMGLLVSFIPMVVRPAIAVGMAIV
jgi:uncharacterized protein (DUF2062 family)